MGSYIETLIVYFLGDFNIHVNTFRPATGFNKAANDFSNFIAFFYFQPLIDKPTREVSSSSTLLDNIYIQMSQILATFAHAGL